MQLDHLAVAAMTLEEAAAHVETALGLPMQPGGAHPQFGTHNRLMGLGEGLYLEAIAINPEAPAPDRARWFDLDRLSGVPHLRNWIVRVDDLDAAVARHPEAGTPLALARGDLRWRMAVPGGACCPSTTAFRRSSNGRGRRTPRNASRRRVPASRGSSSHTRRRRRYARRSQTCKTRA